MEVLNVNNEQVIVIENREAWGACEHCGKSIRTPLPVIPLYTLEDAAQIVPCSTAVFRQRIKEFQKAGLLGVPLYIRKAGLATARQLYRAPEVQLVRNYQLRTINPDWSQGATNRDGIKKFIRVAELYQHDVRLLFDDPPLRWKDDVHAQIKTDHLAAAPGLVRKSPEARGDRPPEIGQADGQISPDAREQSDGQEVGVNGKRPPGNE